MQTKHSKGQIGGQAQCKALFFCLFLFLFFFLLACFFFSFCPLIGHQKNEKGSRRYRRRKERKREKRKKKEKKERGELREEGKIYKSFFFFKCCVVYYKAMPIILSATTNKQPRLIFKTLPNTSTHVNLSYEHHFITRFCMTYLSPPQNFHQRFC